MLDRLNSEETKCLFFKPKLKYTEYYFYKLHEYVIEAKYKIRLVKFWKTTRINKTELW